MALKYRAIAFSGSSNYVIITAVSVSTEHEHFGRFCSEERACCDLKTKQTKADARGCSS